MNYQLQDVGDGGGLDVLDEDGDLLRGGLTVDEAVAYLETVEGSPDETIVRVLRGALGRGRDEEVMIEDLLDELAELER